MLPPREVPISPKDIKVALEAATAAMDLAVDVADWAEAVEQLDWCRQLRIALELLED